MKQIGFTLVFFLFSWPVMAMDWQSPLLQDHPLVGKIFHLPHGTEITQGELREEMSAARFVLLGEKHDNPDHHSLEARILRELLAQNPGLTVVFEMLDDSQQAALDRINPGASLDTLKDTLSWPQNSWDWQSYGPLIKLSLDRGATVRAGNISRDGLQAIYRQDDASLAGRFPSAAAIDAAAREEIQQQVFDSHCGLMPLSATAPMVNVQLARDASMARAMVEDNPGKAVLVSGGFHTHKALAVPRHLQSIAPQAGRVVVLMLEVEEGALDLEDYLDIEAAQADYIWFTPKATDRDYCESLRNHKGMQRK